jgi:poly [ADP-ribose] polymerase 2/3/4
MELIFNQQYFEAAMQSYNYDVKKLPLGKLSKSTIKRGYQALKDLSAMLDSSDATAYGELEQLSNLYYSFIPHVCGVTESK